MNFHFLFGLVSTIACLLPVLVILFFRLFTNKSFLAIGAYYLFAFAYNLITGDLLHVSPDIKRSMGLLTNIIHTPLLLFFLLLFAESPKIYRRIKIVATLYIVYELLIAAFFRYNAHAITIAVGSGIVVNFIFCAYFFYKQLGIAMIDTKKIANPIMTGSLLFAYGCYGFIYLFYYVIKNPDVVDLFTVFYIVSIVSALLMSLSLWMEGKKIREVQRQLVSCSEEGYPAEGRKTTNLLKILFFQKEHRI